MFDATKLTQLQNDIAAFIAFQPDPTGKIEVVNKKVTMITDFSDMSIGQIAYIFEYNNTESEDPMTYYTVNGTINFKGVDQAIACVQWLKSLPIPPNVP